MMLLLWFDVKGPCPLHFFHLLKAYTISTTERFDKGLMGYKNIISEYTFNPSICNILS